MNNYFVSFGILNPLTRTKHFQTVKIKFKTNTKQNVPPSALDHSQYSKRLNWTPLSYCICIVTDMQLFAVSFSLSCFIPFRLFSGDYLVFAILKYFVRFWEVSINGFVLSKLICWMECIFIIEMNHLIYIGQHKICCQRKKREG